MLTCLDPNLLLVLSHLRGESQWVSLFPLEPNPRLSLPHLVKLFQTLRIDELLITVSSVKEVSSISLLITRNIYF